jgi:hypothetical protein
MAVSIEWTGLITGLVGIGGALAGVLLTQRGQRRIAHETRNWEQQARVYVELIAWGRNVEYLVRPWSATGPVPVWDSVPELSQEIWDKAWAYSSQDVLGAAARLRQMRKEFHEEAEPDPQADERRARAMQESARQLRLVARAELQGGHRRRWRRRLPPFT